jgi:hypothetical protein
MELLGDVGHAESCFGPCKDSPNLVGKIGAQLAPNVP